MMIKLLNEVVSEACNRKKIGVTMHEVSKPLPLIYIHHYQLVLQEIMKKYRVSMKHMNGQNKAAPSQRIVSARY